MFLRSFEFTNPFSVLNNHRCCLWPTAALLNPHHHHRTCPSHPLAPAIAHQQLLPQQSNATQTRLSSSCRARPAHCSSRAPFQTQPNPSRLTPAKPFAHHESARGSGAWQAPPCLWRQAPPPCLWRQGRPRSPPRVRALIPSIQTPTILPSIQTAAAAHRAARIQAAAL